MTTKATQGRIPVVGIIGHGFVGSALAYTLDVAPIIVDPRYGNTTVEDLLASSPDFIFLCVPTPTNENGCDDSLVLTYAKQLRNYPGTLIIKSTVPPSTVEHVLEVRSQEGCASTVFWPEFLREDHAIEDILNPELTVLGSKNTEDATRMLAFIETFSSIVVKQPFYVEPVAASIFKYAVNSFLATKVVFVHQLQQWMQERGNASEWPAVQLLLENEPRIGSSHLEAPGKHGYGYAGSCFPKDVAALLRQAEHDSSALPLLEQVRKQNDDLRK